MDSSNISNVEGIFYGRLFTLGGSALFLIGSFIAVYYAYQDYKGSI